MFPEIKKKKKRKKQILEEIQCIVVEIPAEPLGEESRQIGK